MYVSSFMDDPGSDAGWNLLSALLRIRSVFASPDCSDSALRLESSQVGQGQSRSCIAGDDADHSERRNVERHARRVKRRSC